MVESNVINEKSCLNEKLREAACLGDCLLVRELIIRGADINSKNEVNGWTSLHWAAHRGHSNVLQILLSNGGDKSVINFKGETPACVCKSQSCISLLGSSPARKSENKLPIIPNYLKHPALPEKLPITDIPSMISSTIHSSNSLSDEIVLKIRIANCGDPDFIEIELPKNELTFSKLVKTCSEELNTVPSQISRIRKLPNTVLRKDKDVQRLRDYQELELVLAPPNTGTPSNGVLHASPVTPVVNGNGYESIHLRKNQTILY